MTPIMRQNTNLVVKKVITKYYFKCKIVIMHCKFIIIVPTAYVLPCFRKILCENKKRKLTVTNFMNIQKVSPL